MKNDESSFKELRALVEQGAAKRWGSSDKEIVARLEEELVVIGTVGCAAYFTFAAKLVAAIRRDGGLIGPGRGACGGSAVCYALGITGVDPLKHELLFERFLHRGLKHARLILIDVDEAGEKAGRGYLEDRFACKYEERKIVIAPQFVEVDGVGEIGLTRIPELDHIAETVRKIREGGKTIPDLDKLPDNSLPCEEGRGEIRYEDDLMLIGQREGKLDPAASDGMRKAICMRLQDRVEQYKRLFEKERWGQLWNAAEYLFPKAHCVCTARLYAQMAYLKTYYPLEWNS